MGNLYVVTPGASLLVPLDQFMAEVKIPEDDRELALEILEQTCARIESNEFIGRPLRRQKYREELDGNDEDLLDLLAKPLARIDTIAFDGGALTVSDFSIDNREWSYIYRLGGFQSGSAQTNPWSVTTTAGYFVRDDNFLGDVEVIGSDQSYNGTGFTSRLAVGDEIEGVGFSNVQNRGRKIVSAVTSTKITVASSVPMVDEAAASRTLRFDVGWNGLPGNVIRAVMLLAKNSYQKRSSSAGQGAVIEETIAGGTTVRWSAPKSGQVSSQQTGGGEGAIEAEARALLVDLIPRQSAIVELMRA